MLYLTPVFVGLLMVVIVVEQFYLLRPLIQLYRLTGDRDLLVASGPFLIILLGALASVILSVTSSFLPYVEGTLMLRVSSSLRGILEGVAFLYIVATSYKRELRGNSSKLISSLFLLAFTDFFLIFSMFLFIAAEIWKYTRRVSEYRGSSLAIIIIGSLLLISSRIVVVYPWLFMTEYGRLFMSAFLEMFGLSNMIIMREIVVPPREAGNER